MDLTEIAEKIKKLISDSRALLDRADEQNRGLTADEEVKWQRINEAIDEAVAERTALNRKNLGWGEPATRPDPNANGPAEFRNNLKGSDEIMNTRKIENNKREIMIYDKRALKKEVEADKYQYDARGKSQSDAFNRYLMHGASGISDSEYRALSADTSSEGGYLTLPQEMAKSVIVELDNLIHIRKRSTVITLSHSDTFRATEISNDIGSMEWTSELLTGTDDNDLDFIGRDFTCHPLARRIRVSRKLMRISSLNPEQLVKDRLMAVAARVLENAYINGNGVNQPMGFGVSSSHGVNNSRDVETAVAGTFGADDIVNVCGELKQPYRAGAVFLASRAWETRARKLKDGEGRWMLTDLGAGAPPTIMGYPLLVSEYVNDDFTTGDYCAFLINFKQFWIIDSLFMEIQRLEEIAARTNQIEFIFRYEGDANIADQNGIVRMRIK